MGMSNNGSRNERLAVARRSLRSRYLEGWVRVSLLLFGFAGVLWPAVALPSFSRTTPAAAAAAHIVADDRFRPGALANVLSGIEDGGALVVSQPQLVRADALVRLRLAEDAMAHRSSEEADRAVAAAERRVESALAVSPGDSFLWLMLYSVRTTQNGFDPRNTRYLSQSYLAGPYEGWIALRRNQSALAIFPILPSFVAKLVAAEFALIVDANFIEEAATVLKGVGWAHRDQLTSGLDGVEIAYRKALVRKLSREGIKISIPGVEMDDRPW